MCSGLRLASLFLIVGLASGCAATGPAGKSAVPGGAWSPRAQAPLALTEVAAAPIAGQIWVAGGFNSQGQAVNNVQVYGPEHNAWTAGPALPEPVHHATLIAAGNDLYLVGGYVGSSFRQPTAAVRRFDPAALGWVDAVSLPEPRAAGAVAWDGERIVYGGGVGPGGPAGEVYALEGGVWSVVGELSRPREHLGAASDGQGRVWFLGGRERSLERNLATVDLVEGGRVRALGQLRTARGGVAAFWSGATGACLAGGEAPAGTIGTVECIDTAGAVVGLPSLKMPRHGLGAAVVDGIAYVLLGGPRPGLSVSGTVEALPLKG
ncbi:MAG: Kelch repeat-containing protein [Egibacteraceae bacterium]